MVMGGQRGPVSVGFYAEWRAASRCKALSPNEADKLFFPGSGGSPKKADAFCSRCPVREECLREAIVLNLEGFYAGFTKEERTIAGRHLSITPVGIDAIMPPEPKRRRRVYRKIVTEVQDTLTYLDSLSGPLDVVGP